MTTAPSNRPEFDADEILDGIRQWVMVESPTSSPDGVNRMMDLAGEAMATLGADIDRQPGGTDYGDVVRAKISGHGDGPGILVLGHLDTVHLKGTLAGDLPWSRQGDKVFGPGIYDMKGGMYNAYYALRQVLRAGGRPKLPVTFLFIPNEEVGSPTTRALIEAEAANHAYVLVPEPAKGEDGNLVTGRFAFARFTIHARGRPAHAGSTLARGRSAIAEISRQVLAIEALSDTERGVTYSVGVIEGGTFVNVVPTHCTAEVLAVAPSEQALADVQATMMTLKAINPEIKLTIVPGPVRPLFEANEGVMALYGKAEVIAQNLGFTPGHGSFGGGSDGNFTGALGIPTLDGLGLCGDGAHTHDEHILYSSLVPRARLLAGLFETLG